MGTLPASPSNLPRAVRHAGPAPGWVVQVDDPDGEYRVAHWDGRRWTAVARQRADGSTEDTVTLVGDTDDAMVVEALELLEHRWEQRRVAGGIAKAALVVALCAVVGMVAMAATGTWPSGLLALALPALTLGAGVVGGLAYCRGRGQCVLSSEPPLPRPAPTSQAVTSAGDVFENADLGSQAGARLLAAVLVVVAVLAVVALLAL